MNALGYGGFVKLDPASQYRKVTLAWNAEDIKKVWGSLVDLDGPQYKYFDLPMAQYGSSNYDAVIDADGTTVGFSMFTGYTYNERQVISLATVAPDVPEGAEVKVIWGEPDGGTSKPTVERHEQIEIRAVVSPVPFSAVARKEYAGGWRTKQS